jgi:hypothetical protein
VSKAGSEQARKAGAGAVLITPGRALAFRGLLIGGKSYVGSLEMELN